MAGSTLALATKNTDQTASEAQKPPSRQAAHVDRRQLQLAQLKRKTLMAESPQAKHLSRLQNTAAAQTTSVAQRALIVNQVEWFAAPPSSAAAAAILRIANSFDDRLTSIEDVISADETYHVTLSPENKVAHLWVEDPESEDDSSSASSEETPSSPDEAHIGMGNVASHGPFGGFNLDGLAVDDDDEELFVPVTVVPKEVDSNPDHIDRIPAKSCAMAVRGLLSCFAIFIETVVDGRVTRISGAHFLTPEWGTGEAASAYVLNQNGRGCIDGIAALAGAGTRRACIGWSGEFPVTSAFQSICAYLRSRGINNIVELPNMGAYKATIGPDGAPEYTGL